LRQRKQVKNSERNYEKKEEEKERDFCASFFFKLATKARGFKNPLKGSSSSV